MLRLLFLFEGESVKLGLCFPKSCPKMGESPAFLWGLNETISEILRWAARLFMDGLLSPTTGPPGPSEKEE